MRSLFNIGVYPSNTFEVNKNTKIINTISIYGIIATLFFVFVTLPFAQLFYLSLCMLTILSLSAVLFLNHSRKYLASKMVLMFFLPLIVVFFGIAFGQIGSEYYLFAEIIYLFFLFKKTSSRIFVFTYISILLIGMKLSHQNFGPLTNIPLASWLYYPNGVIAFALSFLGLNLFFKEHIRYQNLVENQNTSLKEQHAEISEQKDELEKLNVIKDKLFSVIGHDLRGPLRSLISLLDMFGKDYIDLSHLKEQIPKISEKLNNTTNLVENLLAWARSQLKGIKPKIESFSLSEEINNTIGLFSENIRSKDLKLNVTIDSQCFLNTDKEIFKTILRNLVHNAIKFSRESGHITILQTKNDTFIELRVADEGIGMSSDFVEKFNNDESIVSHTGTAGETGTGLGLMLIKDFLKLIGGKIYLQSTLHEGSSFTLFFEKNGQK